MSPTITGVRTDYTAPDIEVLGELTDLAAGAGDEGALVVMQTGGGIPGG